MTPKEKAIELVEKYRNEITRGIVFTTEVNFEREKRHTERAKACATIAVDLILEGDHLIRTPLSFWQEVKQQISEL